MVSKMKQKISQCMDGELEAHEAAQIYVQLSDSQEFRAEWTLYHMIGDGLRDAPDLSPGFAARLGERLAGEPTVLAPHPIVQARRQGFANVAMYAAASLAAVGVVGWFALSPQLAPQLQGAPQVAGQQAAALASAAKTGQQRPVMSPLNSRDRDYLLAHQAVASGAMPGVAPYVRTVSFGAEANAQ
jgi:sigma-E factor negative regulatory protein RseA